MAVFAVVAILWYLVDVQLAASANGLAASQKRDLFTKLLDMQGRDLDALVNNPPLQDEAQLTNEGFGPPPRQGGPLDGPPNDRHVGPRNLFVFDSHWKPRRQPDGPPLSQNDIDSLQKILRKSDQTARFYHWRDGIVEEYRAKCLRNESGRVYAYAVAREAWSPTKINDLSRITESEAWVVAPGQERPPVTDQGYTVAIPLVNSNGITEAELRFVVRTDALLYAMNRSRLAGVFLLVLMIALTSALMGTLAKRLFVPLRRLAKGLEEHDHDLARELHESPLEIAELAEAISLSFEQKNELDRLNKQLASTIESLNEANAQLSSYNEALEQRVEDRTRDIGQAIETTIFGWSKAMDSRDHETEGHTKRVSEMAQALGEKAGLDQHELRHLRFGALLHDIGKIGIPDSILLKPGKLTEGEIEVMRTHTTLGYEMLKDIPFLEEAVDVVLYHHERWDGAGYPQGLRGEQIPFAARLFAIADVWDALRSNRPYREAWSEERVRDYIKEQAGTQFDPDLVDLFLSLTPLRHPSDRRTQRKAA